MGSLSPGCTIQLWCSSGLEPEARLGPTSAGSLCSRLRRDVAYCCPVRPSPSGDREYAMDGSPVLSPALAANGCHVSGASSVGLKVRRPLGRSWGLGQASAADSRLWVDFSADRDTVRRLKRVGGPVCRQEGVLSYPI